MFSSRKPEQPNQIYFIIFEDYLQPRKPLQLQPPKNSPFPAWTNKSQPRSLIESKNGQSKFRVKLLEHPLLVSSDSRSKWQKFKDLLTRRLGRLHHFGATQKVQPVATSKQVANIENEPIIEINKKTKDIAHKWCQRAKLNAAGRSRKLYLPKTLPKFLAFLKARNDDGLCKRKTGFEIYCELASIHGFKNFVGASTWQRALWCGIVCLAMFFSVFVLIVSHFMTLSTPTILYTESTTHSAWTIPFPAVTICNVNRISRESAKTVARQFPMNTDAVLESFRYSLYNTATLNNARSQSRFLQMLLASKNYTISRLHREISSDCSMELLQCKWKGSIQRCDKLFRKVDTAHGACCSFNYQGLRSLRDDQLEYTTSCGYKTGLSVLLRPNLSDYMASEWKSTRAYYVLIHEAYTYPDMDVQRHILQPRTEATISIRPRQTSTTDFVRDLAVQRRRCYFPDERKLFHFSQYTQGNCLAECRNHLIFEKCGCTLSLGPRIKHWPECRPMHSQCVQEHRGIFTQTLRAQNQDYRSDRFAENFICDCYPLCQLNQYDSVFDEAVLNRTFAKGDRRFFKDFSLKDDIVLQVYFGDLTAEKIRMDVLENWLSFIGTFGGITGLYMGYSFVSGFEMIFFVFVRPACNWLTRQQIRYRIKRRKKKAAAEKAKKAKAEMLLREQQADSTNEGEPSGGNVVQGGN